MISERYGTYERGQLPYNFYAERMSYQGSPPMEKEVHVEYNKPKFSPCMAVLAVIFILFVIILVICLIIFFTWGSAYRPNNAPGAAGRLQDRGGFIFDVDVPRYVLDAKKNGAKLCLLDTATSVQRYYAEHIPDARYFDISKVTKRSASNVSFEFDHPLKFQTYARSLGIDNDCRIVAYDHSETNGSIATATFVWFLFKLYGHKNVTLMNGGLNAWKKEVAKEAETYQTTSHLTNVNREGDFDAFWDPKYMAGIDDVTEAARKTRVQLVDTRKSDDYKGVTKTAEAKEGGHIRTALNAPLTEMLTDDGALKNLPDLIKWLNSKSVVNSKPIIVYDNSPVEASALFLVLNQANYLVQLYDGGWKEFSYKGPSDLKDR